MNIDHKMINLLESIALPSVWINNFLLADIRDSALPKYKCDS